METNRDLCGNCSYCYEYLQSFLSGDNHLEGQRDGVHFWVDHIQKWKLPEDLREGCNFCSFLSQLHLENCDCGDPASHKEIKLRAKAIPLDDFVQPPMKEPFYLTFHGVGWPRSWWFFEDFEKDHSKGTIGCAREVNPKLGETDWSMIRQWIDGCIQRHECDCNSPLQLSELEVLPELEVIDCKTRKLALWDRKAEFAALSYVWGSETEQNPTGDSPKSQQSRHILPDPLPEKGIEDALACTSKLNIPYLWVDRYCIDQEDISGKKQHLIQNMDTIYSAATVTIINMSGDDAYAGLPGISNTLRISPQSSAILGRHKIIPVVIPINDFKTSKWARRGWTLQEGLLARRRLIFTDTRVYFQCNQSHRIENVFGEFHPYERKNYHSRSFIPQVATQAFPSSIIGSQSSSSSIGSICDDFTGRDLKTDTDALNACLGIFSRLWKREKPVYHYCGLPFLGNSDTSFGLSLLWKFETFHDRRFDDRYTEDFCPPGGYPTKNFHPQGDHLTNPFRRNWGPSWSWISWRVLLRFTRSDLPRNDDPFKLCVDIRVPKDNKPQDVMFTIGDYIKDIDENNGLYQHWLPYLRLSGWITTVCFRPCHNYHNNEFDGIVYCCLDLAEYTSGERCIGSGTILPPMWAKLLKDDEAFDSSRSLEVMIIADGGWCKHCLVIHRVGEVEAGTYERMGTCHLYYHNPSPMEHVEGISYLTVEEYPSWERRKLECRWETITLK